MIENCELLFEIRGIQNINLEIQNAIRESAIAVVQIQEMICWMLHASR